ncbi:MAG: helix-turn-helix domain-containing protein [Acidimicrobiales bacterium]|nr:helix-turn-helix domain-containing protein [Acidimicrobiales bacterium]
MSTLQEQARALGDPTRYSIYHYLATSDDPVDVAELTEHFGFNHNAIRQHLAKLVAADLVVEEKATASGPGRPRLLYSIDPSADSRWDVTGPYERLSLMLTEVIRTGDSAREVGQRTGRTLRDEHEGDDDLTRLCAVMARQGFDPELRRRRDRTDVVLRTCPFESSALADPDTICQLHLGIAEGLAEEGAIEVEDLIRKDPRRANCRLQLSVDEPTRA